MRARVRVRVWRVRVWRVRVWRVRGAGVEGEGQWPSCWSMDLVGCRPKGPINCTHTQAHAHAQTYAHA